jgi:stage II sporulation protein D
MKNIVLTAFIACMLVCVNIFADLKARETINVGILIDADSFNIASDKKYSIRNSKKILHLSPGNINIRILADKIIAGKYNLELPVKITPESYILINKVIYRGTIIVKLSKNRNLNVINELAVEDYLKGVLPKEVGKNWSLEALKAQAVISRTYAVKNLNKHICDGFDVCSTVHCQVYGGASAEDKNCNNAVENTKNEVLTFKGELAQTVFHASCGGYTEDPKYVWDWKNETPDYLKGRKDKYCSESPHNEWTCALSETIIRKKLLSAGYKIGSIKKITLSGNTGGHAKEFVIITHKDGKLKLKTYKFRLAVDSGLIKSAMIKNIKRKGTDFVFSGKGWGHRVGLCQCGAKVMAEKGFSYKKILQYYYPKTEIKNIEYEK